MRIQRQGRTGFTIVEMMVATALILFIMAIISEVFASASKTYTTLRVAGDLQEKLRTGATAMRRDLTAEHFGGPFIPGRSGPRVGDQRLDLAGWVPPDVGYFEIRQFGEGSPPNSFVPVVYDPNGTYGPVVTDPEGLWSSRATNHVLRFTVHLPDLPAPDLHCVQGPNYPINAAGQRIDLDPRVNSFPVNPGVIYSRWAEVQYFLLTNNDTTTANANGVSLNMYSLRRRIRVLAPTGVSYDGVDQTVLNNTIAQYPELGIADWGLSQTIPGTHILRVLGPEDVTNPQRRMPYQLPVMKSGAMTGDDILMTDVLSMEVKAAWLWNVQFNSPVLGGFEGASPPPFSMALNNADDPFDNLWPCKLNTILSGQRIFDTWYKAPTSDNIDWDKPTYTNGFLSPRPDQVPLRINVRAIQIRLRIYDRKAEQARQVTIVQEI